MIATLVHAFHLTIPEIAALTPFQIRSIYFHPRNDQGEIVPQWKAPQPGELAYELEQARIVAAKLNVDPAPLLEKVKEQWNIRTKNSKAN